MAKRVGKDEPEEQEDYDFVPPDFDEDAFIHKEMVSFRTTSTLIVVGILAAVASWLLYPLVGGAPLGWFLGLALLAGAFVALRPLFKVLKFDISHYQRREWIGTGFLLFFTWLAFFMILLNPPFSDFADPDVTLYASPNAAEAGQEIAIDLFVTDNAGAQDPTFSLTDATGTVIATESDLSYVGLDHYQYRATLDAGTYHVEASAQDDAGHRSDANTTITVQADIVDVTVGDLTDNLGVVFVTVPDDLDIWAVYADMDGSRATTDDRVYFEEDEALGGWKASANFEGWHTGNNTFTVFVEEKNRFEGPAMIEGGILTDGPHTVTVGTPGDYDGGVPSKANPTEPQSRKLAPGLGMPLLAVGILAAVAIARRK